MASSKAKTNIEVVFGAMTLGNGKEQSRVTDLPTCNKILDIFQSHGHNEIDTSRFYGSGTSEEYLQQCDWKSRGLIMDTKLYPTVGKGLGQGWGDIISHSPEDLRKHLDISLQALGSDKVDLWYLHAPDRTVPFEVTMKTVDELYKEGKFERLGLSNYMAWEVAQICELCIKNDWVRPSVYQGVYNALHRTIEAELLLCLRHYKMSFYSFNPLAGGFFTTFTSKTDTAPPGSRFDPDKLQGKMYRSRYWNDEYFEAINLVRPIAEKNGLTMGEIALRWMMHHSVLRSELGDKVIIGASSVSHIEENLVDFEKGPLPEEVVEKLDEAWLKVRGLTTKYWH